MEEETLNNIQEEPYAVNSTTVTDEMNRAVLKYMVRKSIYLNVSMITAGVLFAVLIVLVAKLGEFELWTAGSVFEFVVCGLLVVIGASGLAGTNRFLNQAVKSVSETAGRRKTYFFGDRLLVETGFEETVLPMSRFVKMKKSKNMIMFSFTGRENRREVFFVTADGFENEEQLKAVLENFKK